VNCATVRVDIGTLVIKSAVWLTFARYRPLALCGISPLRSDVNGIGEAERNGSCEGEGERDEKKKQCV
jgi:hypothetical protein